MAEVIVHLHLTFCRCFIIVLTQILFDVLFISFGSFRKLKGIQPYSSTDTALVEKISAFVLSERSDILMIVNQS